MVKPPQYDRSTFFYAWQGIRRAAKEERNLRFHFLAAFFVLIAALLLHMSVGRIAVIMMTCALVIALELLNTALEALVDMVCPEDNRQAGYVKDVAAGAVLVAAIGAAIIGILLFGEAVLTLLR